MIEIILAKWLGDVLVGLAIGSAATLTIGALSCPLWFPEEGRKQPGPMFPFVRRILKKIMPSKK